MFSNVLISLQRAMLQFIKESQKRSTKKKKIRICRMKLNVKKKVSVAAIAKVMPVENINLVKLNLKLNPMDA